MNAPTAAAPTPERHEHLAVQFEDIEQQRESYIVGMWSFLVTEVMFFGALFLIYAIYRWQYHRAFYEAHLLLDVNLGTTNTFILLASSLTMALGVHYAQLRRRGPQLLCLVSTMGLAGTFLAIKAVEYSHKFAHHLFPGGSFHFPDPTIAQHAKLFYSLYFAATGLHAAHVVIGIGVIGWMAIRALRDTGSKQDYMPVELTGLYWHFVDIVWIFLFPLLYLMPK